MERNWTTVATETVDRLGGREAVEKAIGALDWETIPERGKVTVGFMPGEAINHAIRELNLPRVSAIAIDSQAVPVPAYSLSGYGAEIRRCRERVEQIKRDKAAVESGDRGRGRAMLARFSSSCVDCGEPIEKGSPITYYRATREAVHGDGCGE